MEAKARDVGQSVTEQAQETAQDLADRAKSAGIAAWEKAKDTYSSAQDRAVQSAKVADKTIRENPYQAIGIAFGVGLLLGFILKKK